MKEITLMLTEYQMFNIASLELGRFLSDDATPEERLTHIKNIDVLNSQLGEELRNEFNEIYRVITQDKEALKQGIEIIERYKEEIESIFKM